MKKLLKILTIAAAALLAVVIFTTCKQFLDDPEEFFSYWSAELVPIDYSIDKPTQTAGGASCVPSANDVKVTIKLHNPKNFRLVTPASSADVIRFPGLTTQPSHGNSNDYTLVQTANDKLELKYNATFLKDNELSNGDISPEITLVSTDGRRFGKNFSFNLKVNTPPPKPAAVLAKTTTSPATYVLCLQVPDMTEPVPGGLLHKDIAQIEINGTPYPLTVSGGDFVKPSDAHFITAVTQLAGYDTPPSGAWILYYDTGLAVGSAYQPYTVKLKDNKGLVSETLETGTARPQLPAETVTVTRGQQSTGSGLGGTTGDPIIINGETSAPEAQITIAHSTPGTTVHCEVQEIVGASSTGAVSQYDTNPVTASLGLAGEDEKLYKVKYHTDGTGYTPTSTTIKYYKVLKCHSVTFNANGGTFLSGSTLSVLVPHGTVAAAPSTPPTRAGYTLGSSWYKDQNCMPGQEWNFTTQITSDKQLYAKWIENPKVTLKVEDGAGGTLTCNYTDENGTSQTCTVSNSAGQTVRIKYKTGVTFNTTPTTGWKVASWTVSSGSFNSGGGTGVSASLNDVTADKTVTVKFYRTEITGTPGSSTAWRDLKRAVEDAPEGATIKIGGEIKATNDEGNKGEISINKKITIEAKTGTATLNADELNTIFSVMGNNKELTLKNLILKKGKGTGNGGGIFLYAGKVTLQNTNIENCSANNGGAIYAHGGTLTITGGVFRQNTAKTDGGAIYIKEGCNLTLNNVTIGGSTADANKAKNGGGICLTGIGTTGTMNGGKVSYNEAVRNDDVAQGGGIFIEKSASFTMNDGEISYNKSERTGGTAYGGGVCVSGENCSPDKRSKFIFKKGRIEMNTSGYGGGVMASDGGIFEMGGSYNNADTVIKGNSVKSSGGGVSVHGAMKMLSGTIEQNTANTQNSYSDGGGGIYLWWTPDGGITFDMSGGIIKNNNNSGTNSIGKGMLVSYGSGTVKMRMSGSAKIDTDNDVHLGAGAKITVDSPLSHNPAAQITPNTYNTSTQVLDGNAVSSQYTKFKVTPKPFQNWSITGSGYLTGP